MAKQSDACKSEGKPEITPLLFPSNDRAVAAVEQGRADILLTDAGVVTGIAQSAPTKVQVGFAIPSDFIFGFGVNKNDDATFKALYASLQAQYEDGSLKKALEQWGFSDASSSSGNEDPVSGVT